MKKFMFIFLLVIPFCKAADTDNENWNRAVQDPALYNEFCRQLNLSSQGITTIPINPNLPGVQVDHLVLRDNLITTIPNNLRLGLLANLRTLDLSKNWIYRLDPEALKQFRRLEMLSLSENPIPKKDVDDLKQAYPHVTIIACKLLEGINIKGDC